MIALLRGECGQNDRLAGKMAVNGMLITEQVVTLDTARDPMGEKWVCTGTTGVD